MLSREKVAPILGEFLGTAVLAFATLAVTRSAVGISYFAAIGVGLTLMLLVLTLGKVSGAHVNPAVTFGMWTLRKIKTSTAILYIAAQFLGAAATYWLYTYLIGNELLSTAGKEFDWQIFVAEAVGTFVFTFGFAAAVYQKYSGGIKAATIGGSLGLGILVAGVASNALLNPAVALGVRSWSLTYAIAPLVGAVIGMNLYALVFSGENILPTKLKSKKSSNKK